MRVALLGLGVMGGSLARALHADGEIDAVGWAEDAADREAAARLGISVAGEVSAALEVADVVVLATPLSAVEELAEIVAAGAPPSAVVTDVASLQAPVLAAATSTGLADRWVTAHPLVGSERSGFGAARQGLYAAAKVYLSADGADDAARATVEDLWSRLDAVGVWIDAVDHDVLMARVSHLPQVVATALADALAESGLDPDALGPGGRDTTRLAGSSPTMWRDLLTYADPSLVDGLRAVARRLDADAEALAAGDPAEAVERLERAGRWRRGP